jgi:hypothetical protein
MSTDEIVTSLIQGETGERTVRHWQTIAASVKGSGHEKTGKPCQDAHSFLRINNSTIIAAVADGAGSAALAEVGANRAIEAAIESTKKSLQNLDFPPESDEGWHLLLRAKLEDIRAAIESEAKARESRLRDLATTIILVVATPDVIALAQVGDGSVVIENRCGDIIRLSEPQDSEYINETIFITSPDALAKAQITIWRGQVINLAMFSDGLEILCLRMQDGTPHEPFFIPLFRFASSLEDNTMASQQLAQFLGSPRIREHTDDDVTLILAHLRINALES